MSYDTVVKVQCRWRISHKTRYIYSQGEITQGKKTISFSFSFNTNAIKFCKIISEPLFLRGGKGLNLPYFRKQYPQQAAALQVIQLKQSVFDLTSTCKKWVGTHLTIKNTPLKTLSSAFRDSFKNQLKLTMQHNVFKKMDTNAPSFFFLKKVSLLCSC